MHRLVLLTVAAAVGVSVAGPASADILINVSKASQRVTVLVDGSARYMWPISSGRAHYITPSGVFQPEWVARMWRSRQYHNSPMPFSIFFHNGYALHGTEELSRLGKPASHGCVRLDPKNAKVLYDLVRNRMAETRIVVSNDAIQPPGVVLPLPKPRAPKTLPLLSDNADAVYSVSFADDGAGGEALVATPTIASVNEPRTAAEPELPASPAQVEAADVPALLPRPSPVQAFAAPRPEPAQEAKTDEAKTEAAKPAAPENASAVAQMVDAAPVVVNASGSARVLTVADLKSVALPPDTSASLQSVARVIAVTR